MPTFTISGQSVDITPDSVVAAVADVLPEPIHEHYVIVDGRRFPPKQLLTRVTGLDRADFTTHQARRILKRLGFTAARTTQANGPSGNDKAGEGPHGGRQARALEPYVGKWVALADPTTVLVAADSPQEVLAWLATHERRALYGMFRVPAMRGEAEGMAPL
jgi:hypothetical protein